MEILSPAGSPAALEAAVHYGADAVYVGGSRFSARSSAQNFTDEELLAAVDFCHVRGVRLYVCCNTLLQETELAEAMAFIRYVYQIGADALIVQDLGLIRRVRQELPDFPLHASTQMTIVNHDGVQALADLGLQRVVLAREVTAAELASIRQHTDMELEYFVHGALCISYSGQCLMSSLLGGRSGNRGGCAQPCRLPYTLLRNGKPVTETLPLLCPKDLCLAERVHKLADLGVASLKIEGRMKSPAYVAMVTQIYKQALTGSVSDSDIRNMLKFFSRGGSCAGYFDGCTYGEMMDTRGQAKIAGSLPALEKKQRVSPATLHLTARVGEPLSLTMTASGGESVRVTGPVCEQAHTKATGMERMEQQLVKLGGTPFYAGTVTIDSTGDGAVPVGELNSLRRLAAAQLETALAERHRRTLPSVPDAPLSVRTSTGEPSLCAEVNTTEQLQAAMDMGIRRVYLPAALLPRAQGIVEPVVQLEPLTCEGDRVHIQEAAAVCIQNPGQLAACRGRDVTAGHRLNVTNSESAALLFEQGVSRVVLSPELNLKSIARLRQKTPVPLEVIGYGRLPLMLLKNCIIKSAYGCDCENAGFALRDRKNEVFPLLPRHCGNVIYNGKPVYMADRIADIKNLQIEGIRLSFTLENYETCCIIISEYQNALKGNPPKAPEGGFTRGHFYRGMQ